MTDWAGRRVQARDYLPNNDGSYEKWTSAAFNSQGQVTSLTRTGEPARRFAYNPLLGWSEAALDVNANSSIDYSGMDPIRTSRVRFEKISGAWWRIEASGAYATDNSSTHQETGAVETQLTGYSGSELSRTRTRDVTGQFTVRTTTFDWGQKKLETVVDLPTTTNNETLTAFNGQLATAVTAQSLTLGVKYDQFGREIARTDPRKGDSEREFVSGSNDVLRERDEANRAGSAWTSTYTYDSAGRVATVTNALGMVTRYAYNTRGQLIHQWGNAGQPVQFEYNTRGQRTKMHSYRGGSGWNNSTWPGSPGTADTTEWIYAANSGVLTEKRDAGWASNNSRKVTYTYHADGQVAVRSWGRGVTTTYGYNAAGQLSGKTYSDGTPAVSLTQYNRRGQLKAVTDVTGSRVFDYDSEGFMISENLPSSYFGSRSVVWDTDAYGRRIQVGIWQGASPVFTHDYAYESAQGRLLNMTSWSGGNGNSTARTTAYEYHANSNQWHWMRNTWAGHDVERTLETNRDAVSTFIQKSGAYESIKATYSRDALGRITSLSRDNTDNTGAEPNPLFRGYLSQEALTATLGYNERDELTSEDLKAKVGGNWQSTDAMGKNRLSTFSYDNAQNRETAFTFGVTDDPTPNALNQPNTFRGSTVTHDLDGNMSSDGTWSYTYDAENRIKSSSKAGLTITYAYDFMGRRVEMKSDFGSWYFTKRFIWDGWNLIADIWPPEWGSGIASTYVWGIDVSGTVGGAGGVGGLALMYYNGRAFIPLQDGRGNIHGYLDTTSGKNAVSWDFSPYGETLHERGGLSGVYGTQDFLFRYQSKMQDMGGHLLYFGYRFYHPGMGRFPSRDPIGEAGGMNLYGYVRNNPANKWDYLGLIDSEWLVMEEFFARGTSGDGGGGGGGWSGLGGGGGGGNGGSPSTWDSGRADEEVSPTPNNTDEKKKRCQELRDMLDRVKGQTQANTAIEALLLLSNDIYPKQVGSEKEWGGLAYYDGVTFRNTTLSEGTPNNEETIFYHPTNEQKAEVFQRGREFAGVAHGHPSGDTLSLGDIWTALRSSVPVAAVGANGVFYLFDPRSLSPADRYGLRDDVRHALDKNKEEGRQGIWNTRDNYMRHLSDDAKKLLMSPELRTECPEFFK